MTTLWIAALAGGLVGGLVSGLVAATLIRRAAERSWQREVDALEARADRAIRELGDEVEARVKRGVVEGVAALPSADVLRSTRSTAVRTAGELVGEGLSALLRRRGDEEKR